MYLILNGSFFTLPLKLGAIRITVVQTAVREKHIRPVKVEGQASSDIVFYVGWNMASLNSEQISRLLLASPQMSFRARCLWSE